MRSFNGERVPGPQNPEKQGSSVCRDFLRNVCNRGAKCKFSHDTEPEIDKGGKLQDSVVFCHDFQNPQSCSRPNCRFIHCKKEDEDEFKRTGYLPPYIREQLIQKGIAPDAPTVVGKKPICKDFVVGTCRRNHCKFRHVSTQQFDVEIGNLAENQRTVDQYKLDKLNEMTTSQNESFTSIIPTGQGYRAYGVFRDEPVEKRRRVEHVLTIEQMPFLGNVDFEMIHRENLLLRQEMHDLKQEISDLITTNNFLLEQNAQLRMSIKAAAVEGIVPVVSQGDQHQHQQQNVSNQSPVVSMALPTATVAPQGTTITMTMAVPPSSIATVPISMSLPVAQLTTTISGSPLVTTITMAPPQPTGTLVTSMSLGPTLEATQPLVTSINVAATPMESGQIQAAPSLTLQTLSGTPVSTMPTIHAVSQTISPQTVTIAPNSVQVHETRLVSYPIMSVRPRL